MRSLIGDKSFDRYARIVQAVIPDAVGIALCVDNGQPIQYLDFCSDKQLLPAIDRLCEQSPEWGSSSQTRLHALRGQTLLTIGLRNERCDVVATLAILIAGLNSSSAHSST